MSQINKNSRQPWNLHRRFVMSVTPTVFLLSMAAFADDDTYTQHTENILNSMPSEDGQDLESLFRYCRS